MPVSRTALSFLAAVTLAACFCSTKAAAQAGSTRGPTSSQSTQQLTRPALVRFGMSRGGTKWIVLQAPKHWQPLVLPSESSQRNRGRLQASIHPEQKQQTDEVPSLQKPPYWLQTVRIPSATQSMRKLLGDQSNSYVNPMPKTRQQQATVTNGSYQQGDYGKGCFLRCRR